MEDTKRLLRENTRLTNERNELSSVLGEEKEMVRYLHGVIKNYEHLLRYNSSQRQNIVYRNMTEAKFDPDSISNESQAKVPSNLHKTIKDSLFVRQSKDKVMTSPRLEFSLEERHQDMLGSQTVKREVKQKACVEDDTCLEDLEILSASSTEEPSHNSVLQSDEMDRKRWNETQRVPKQNENHLKTLQTVDGISRDGHHNFPDNYQRLNNRSRTRTNNDRPFTTGNTSRHLETSFDAELDELNKELDRIASKLSKHENSLLRSEKHLSKMEHRMEYLESFALGKESEYL
ncbi:uncharacterized protein LOC110241687 [Exaiptasia diaphana]|uniref:Uncharacterized protein n=1 Tax=Exaiptasia diaphana TaxID=2652724 RepID=A0A913XEM1_EXADI|nr:uncharacterized protein LOC110241687 [Exaiptasia diaphana]